MYRLNIGMEHLLFTRDYNKADSEIKNADGRITHKLSDKVFVAHLPASNGSGVLKNSAPEPLSKLDEPFDST